MPVAKYQPDPQRLLIEVPTRQADQESRTRGGVRSLEHGADGDVVPSRRKRLLLIVWQWTGDNTARTRGSSLTQEQEEVSGMERVGACGEHMRVLGAHASQPLLDGNARSDETKKVQADARHEVTRRTQGQRKR